MTEQAKAPHVAPNAIATTSKAPAVYKAIAAVTADLAAVGIAKDRKAQAGGTYQYRGIDDVYAALSPLLKKHSLCILPVVKNRTCTEGKTSKGGLMFYTVVEVDFHFVSSEDGSAHVVTIFGEAMDTSDKSTNKAMSMAYKYCAFMTFCIPTDGQDDTEREDHQMSHHQQQGQQTGRQQSGQQQKGQHDAWPVFSPQAFIDLVNRCQDHLQLMNVWNRYGNEVNAHPEAEHLRNAFGRVQSFFTHAPQ